MCVMFDMEIENTIHVDVMQPYPAWHQKVIGPTYPRQQAQTLQQLSSTIQS
jgi:hypothetical protein